MFLENEVNKVKEYYTRLNGDYTRIFGETLQAYRPASDKELYRYLLNSIGLKDGMRVLDAGCGFGGPAFYFASQLKIHIDAITISPEQSEYAIEKLAKIKLKGKVVPRVEDYHLIENLFEADGFDLIYFLESLVHADNPDMVIKGCQKTLKKGGVLYIKDLFYGVATEPGERERIDIAVKNCNEVTCQTIRPVDEILKSIREHNLKLISVARLPFPSDFSKVNTFYHDTDVRIYKDQQGRYSGIGPEYVTFYEIKAFKPYN